MPAGCLVEAYQIVKLDGRYALVDTRDDLLRDGSSVNVFGIQAIAQAGNTSSDLIELYPLFTVVWYIVSQLLIIDSCWLKAKRRGKVMYYMLRWQEKVSLRAEA